MPRQAESGFSSDDFDRIRSETFVNEVEYHAEISSTNDRALELAERQVGRSPLLVLTEKQTSGRGRGTNRWWSSGGALTFSLLLETAAFQLPPSRWPRASLTAGLAVCEAIQEMLPAHDVELKWPNDVFLQRRKVCGILIEVPRQRSGAIVVGIGINVNNSFDGAPADLTGKATSLRDAGLPPTDLVDVLICVLNRLSERIAWIGSRDDELQRRWRELCLLTNRSVQINVGTRSIAGVCHGIDDDGALLVETQDGIERCFAGVVTHFD